MLPSEVLLFAVYKIKSRVFEILIIAGLMNTHKIVFCKSLK